MHYSKICANNSQKTLLLKCRTPSNKWIFRNIPFYPTFHLRCHSKNKSHGFTPFEFMFRNTSIRPPEMLYIQEQLIRKYFDTNRISKNHRLARERTNFQKQRVKENVDQHVSDRPIGNKVYIKESQIKNKLQNKFNGLFQIAEIHNNSTSLINLKTNQEAKANFDRMTFFSEN